MRAIRINELRRISNRDCRQSYQNAQPKDRTKNEKHAFDLVPGGVDEITLGIPWLRKANPSIGWGSRDITFADGMPNKVPSVREHESLSVVAQTREEMKDDFESGHVMVLWSRVGLASETTATKMPNEYAEFGTLF